MTLGNAKIFRAVMRWVPATASNPAGAKLLANKLLDVSTQKRTEVSSASSISAAISGKVYQFPPNGLRIKSLSLYLADAWPHYALETYPSDTTASLKFTGPIGFDGYYQKGELVYYGLGDRLEGSPRLTAAKGTWQGENTLLIERLELGQGEPAERWTLMFFGDNLSLLAQLPEGQDIFIEAQKGG